MVSLLRRFCIQWALNFSIEYGECTDSYDIHIHGAGKNEDWYYKNMSHEGSVEALSSFLDDIRGTFKCES